jgi:hypothetical protein
VKEDIEKAVEPQVLLKKRLLADPNSAFGTAMVKELAAWKQYNNETFQRLRAELKNIKGFNIRDLDSAIRDRIKQEDARAARHRKRRSKS